MSSPSSSPDRAALRPNRFKRLLAAGQRPMGLWSSLASPLVAEILGAADLDWVLLDMEHAPNDLAEVLAQLQALACGGGGGGPHPLVRVPSNDRLAIRRLIDLGVDSILVPFVETAEEARHAVASALLPPAGKRGLAGSTRASRYGRVQGYPQAANAEICVLVQIESRRGLANLAEIAAVEGLGGLFVGPNDLAADMGFIGQMRHPEVEAAVRQVIAGAHAAGLPIGSVAADPAMVGFFLEAGIDYLAVGSDVGLLVRSLDSLLAAWRPRFHR